jgi:hypothetical protein
LKCFLWQLAFHELFLGRMPFEDFTLVSVVGDTLPVQCVASTDEQVIDVSSQSVEIISHEESQLLKLESLTVPSAGDSVLTQSTKLAGSPDNGRMSEGFMTADFYIDESLPSSPATDTATRRRVSLVSSCLDYCNGTPYDAPSRVIEKRHHA